MANQVNMQNFRSVSYKILKTSCEETEILTFTINKTRIA